MAYIIKSDVSLSNSANAVGNIHGYYGPSDYAAMLDFSHGIYTVDGVDVDLSDVVSMTRASTGEGRDQLGRNITFAANTPRFHTVPELGMTGIVLENGHTNYAEGDTDGSAFTAPNASELIVLSWEGTGTVSLTSSDTFAETASGVEAGRNYVLHSRTGEVSGTISVTGDVSRVMVTNAINNSTYVPHGETFSTEVLRLIGDAASKLTDGTGAILLRFGFLGNGDYPNREIGFGLLNDSDPNGGIYAEVAYKYSSNGTGEVRLVADSGAINSGVWVARNLGSRPVVGIAGLYFENFGETAGVICYGQAGSDTAANAVATAPTAFGDVVLSKVPSGMVSGSKPGGIVLTHVVVYDRAITDTEALKMATFGAGA